MHNELGRLLQGFNDLEGNNVLYFFPKSKVPRGKKVTYDSMFYSPSNAETHRVWKTAGNNIVNYKREPSTPVCSIETIKMHWNPVLCTSGSKCCTADLKDFFLMAALEEHEFLRIHMHLMSTAFTKQCKLEDIVDKDGHIWTEVHGGMCGFPQAGMLAHKDLVKRLTAHRHMPETFTSKLWRHEINGNSFALVVDDFGIKTHVTCKPQSSS